MKWEWVSWLITLVLAASFVQSSIDRSIAHSPLPKSLAICCLFFVCQNMPSMFVAPLLTCVSCPWLFSYSSSDLFWFFIILYPSPVGATNGFGCKSGSFSESAVNLDIWVRFSTLCLRALSRPEKKSSWTLDKWRGSPHRPKQ